MQVRVLTLTERQDSYGREVTDRLLRAGFRAELDNRNEKLGLKIREAQLEKVPYMLVVGDKEAASGTVAPRSRSGETSPRCRSMTFIERLIDEAVPGRRSETPASSGRPALTYRQA